MQLPVQGLNVFAADQLERDFRDDTGGLACQRLFRGLGGLNRPAAPRLRFG